MRQWTGSSLVQVMACCLFGAKPLPVLMLAYCQLDSWEHISVKFESEYYNFHSRKCNWKMKMQLKMSSGRWRPSYLSLNVLKSLNSHTYDMFLSLAVLEVESSLALSPRLTAFLAGKRTYHIVPSSVDVNVLLSIESVEWCFGVTRYMEKCRFRVITTKTCL